MAAKSFGTAAMLALLALMFASPASAQGVGAIGGTVSDSSGAVMPGATVSLSNVQGSVGGNQQSVTDERGNYQFLRLVPGTYVVKAELAGFRPLEQRNIVVNADVTARADFKLEIGALEEGLIVSGQAPLLDTASALKQTVLSKELLNSLPNRGDIWSVARVIPSVVVSKVDVGGSEAFVQSNVTLHGSSNENKYTVDGMDITSLDGNATTAMLYLDPYAYQESNFQMGGGNAEFANGGLTMNMISKTGTNQFHGSGMFTGANPSMSSANYSDQLKAQLLAGVPAAALKANPNIVPGADLLKTYDTGGWLSGPVRRDSLWFSVSAHDQALDQHILGSYDADGTQVLDDNRMWTVSGKLAWQVTSRAQLSYLYNAQKKVLGHRNGGGTFADSRARSYNWQFPNNHQLKFTMPVSTKLLVDVAYSRYRSDTRGTNRPEVHDGDISHFDAVTNTYTVALPTPHTTYHMRDQVVGSLSYFRSSHDVKFGYQFTNDEELLNTFSTSGMRAVYRNGVPDSVNTYNTPIQSHPISRHGGAYIQDKWRATQKLTINAGMRLETNDGSVEPACQPTTQFIEGKCYDAVKGAPDFRGTPGRLSAVYDLFGDGKTALKFAANRYDQPVGIDFSGRVNPVAVSNDTRAWTVCAPGQTSGCDLNGDLLPQFNELGPSNGFSSGATNRYASGLKWPISKEYSIEFQRQLLGSVVTSVSYTKRQTRRNLALRNVAVPAESYIPLTVTEANSRQVVTVYNQAPGLRGRFDNLWSNDSTEDAHYNGMDLTASKRMSNHWSMSGGMSVNRTIGDPVAGDLNNPNNGQFRDGVIGNDVPWSYRMSGAYELPYQIFVSGTAQYYRGFPEITTVSVGNNTVALTQGTTTVWTAARGNTRLPNVASLDTSLRKLWRVVGKSIETRLDFYNVTNQASILSRVTQLGPTYLQASSIQRGRLIKVGVSLDF